MLKSTVSEALNTAYLSFKLPPFKAATMVDVGAFFTLGSKNNPNCQPLSTLSIHHDTPRLHQQVSFPNGTDSRKRTCHRGRAKPHGTATSPFEIFSC